MCLPTSHLPCQSEACSAPADGDRLPARAPKDMDNLLKIVVSESSAVQLDGLLEKGRAVADKITHELLVLASDAVHGRQSTSGAFPSSGPTNPTNANFIPLCKGREEPQRENEIFSRLPFLAPT